MTLVSSGTIRMSDINVELGRSSTANISLDAAENGTYGAINLNSASRPSGTNPAAMSEWYSYNHSAAGAIMITAQVTFSPGSSKSFQINKNGVREFRTSEDAIVEFTASAGDVIFVTVTSPFGGNRFTSIDVFNNGYVGGNTGTVNTTFTFTVVAGSGDYQINAEGYNDL
jgi:hypothetical protein